MVNWELQEGKYVRDPRLGHRFGINYPGGLESNNASINTYQLGTDNYGFIHNGINIKRKNLRKEKNTKRIIITGGSLAMGMGASENNKTIASKIEEILNKENEAKIEVINAACGGYCSWHALIKLSMELISLEPDIVIDISGWNDMMHSSWGSKKDGSWIENHDRSIEDVASSILSLQGKLSFKDFILIRLRLSRIYLIAKKYWLSFIGKQYSTQDIGWGHERNILKYRVEGVNNFYRNIRSMKGTCEIHGIRFIHILQPNPIWQENKLRSFSDPVSQDINLHLNRYKNFMSISAQYLGELKRIYKEVVDSRIIGYKDFSNNLNFALNDWKDHCHLSDSGQLKLAKKIISDFRLYETV